MRRSQLWGEVREPAALLGAAGVGAFVSWRWPETAPVAGRAIAPLLVMVLFSVFARVSLGRLRDAARDGRYVLTVVMMNFVSAPLLAFFLGTFFLPEVPELRVGLFLALLTPCTDWYLIFTHLVGGDVARNLAVLPWNLLLQVALLPVYLRLFTSAWLPVEMGDVGRALLLYVVVPLVAAQLFRWRWGKRPAVARFGMWALVLVVFTMFVSHGRVALAHPALFLRLAPPLLCFYVLSLALSQAVARVLRFPRARALALACTVTARNSPLVLPLAVVLFPEHPIVALSQLIEPVVEIPALILFSVIVRRRAVVEARAPCA